MSEHIVYELKEKALRKPFYLFALVLRRCPWVVPAPGLSSNGRRSPRKLTNKTTPPPVSNLPRRKADPTGKKAQLEQRAIATLRNHLCGDRVDQPRKQS